MSGCRPLSEQEIDSILLNLPSQRDKLLFILGIKTGFRISELLSLRISDVYQNGQVVPRLRIVKSNLKGKTRTREVPLHPAAYTAIRDFVNSGVAVDLSAPLFAAYRGVRRPITRFQGHSILKKAICASGLSGKLGTHSMRKTFAEKVYRGLDHDIFATSRALGHSCIRNTVRYLTIDQQRIDQAILS